MKRLIIAAAATAALALGACETATPYQPLQRGSTSVASGGYAEHAIEANRWQVTFSGNSLTDRKTVETYLLYRSAELTLAQGFDWFEISRRNTDAKTSVFADPDPFWGGYWGPSWRVYGPRFGGWSRWGYWGGWGGPWGAADYHTVTRFEANAEIVMGHGAKPANDNRAFDAHDVSARLGPTIVRPKA